MKIKILIILLLTSTYSFSQGSAKVTGLITELETDNHPLPYANVEVMDGSTSVVSNELGYYSINLPAGEHKLQFSFIGFEPQEKLVVLAEGETLNLDLSLSSDALVLDAVVVQAKYSRDREVALLIEQKNAVSIKQVIGSQEMSRKGVSSAEGAVTKITGVSKQQGTKNVFVRGLGDRYNSTTMNGLPLPSEDPEYKNIALDFFSSDIIQSISVNKTFDSEIYGDVGGANIDIISKELTKTQSLEIGISSSINSQTINQSDFKLMAGGNWFGNVANSQPPITNLSVYSFRNSLNTDVQSMPIASSITASGGYKLPLLKGNLSMFFVGNFSNDYSYRNGNVKQTTSVGTVYQDQHFEKYVYSVSQTALGNFKYRSENDDTIAVNLLYIHDNTQDVSAYMGADDPQEEGDLAFLRRQQMNNNNLFVSQILSTVKLTDKIDLDLGTAINQVNGNEPDRRSNAFLYRFGKYVPSTNSAGENERYFSKLDENDFSAKAIATYNFGAEDQSKNKFTLGYDFRNTSRDFEATIYNHRYVPPYLSEVNIDNVDAIFNQQTLNDGLFTLQTGNGTASSPKVFNPFFYNGKRTIHAVLANVTYDITDKLTGVAGIRFEKVNQNVSYDTNIASSATNGLSKIDKSYILPSVNLKYSINDKSNLRTAGSLSYTMPQFKEVAPFKYQDVSFSSQGNPNLEVSENTNFDLKYEFYPTSEELFALTAFYKNIKNPIARSEIPSGGNTLTYLNVGGQAQVYGLELEVRKNIFKTADADVTSETTLSTGVNISYLNSKQQLENTLPQFTNSSDQLQGAAPLLANADLTFTKTNESYKITSSMVLNYFSDRIFSIGTRGFENVVEKGIPTLDFITQTTFGKKLGLNLKVKNLLNPNFVLTRESNGTAPAVMLSEFKRGVDISVGLSYIF